MSRRPNQPEDIYKHVRQNGECLEWTGWTNNWGYGLIRIAYKVRLTHKVAYELKKGEIPDGMLVLHTCDNPPCLYEGHLFTGTQSDNMKDMHSKGRGRKH